MKIIKGDLIELFKSGQFDYIVHGCNCFCTMGAGIAKQIKLNFPEAYEADLKTIKGDINKLGKFTKVYTEYGGIINLYTQYRYGDGVMLDYVALDLGLSTLNSILLPDSKVGLPLIGCGLAGGDRDRVLNIISKTTNSLNITIVEL